jgi:Serine/threonine protein kinase
MFESFQGGRYKVAKKLGEGGRGIVFKAEDTRLGRAIAIKVIKGEGLDQEHCFTFILIPRETPLKPLSLSHQGKKVSPGYAWQ